MERRYPPAITGPAGFNGEFRLKDKLNTLSSIGNGSVLDTKKLALFCSVKCPGNLILKTYDLAKDLRDKKVTVISGFHSPMEQECLNILLKGTQPMIICPARSIEKMRIPTAWKPALEQKRLLVISPFAKGKKRMTEANAVKRNKFVADLSDIVFISYAAPDSKTYDFCSNLLHSGKIVVTFDAVENSDIIALGAKPIKSISDLEEIL